MLRKKRIVSQKSGGGDMCVWGGGGAIEVKLWVIKTNLILATRMTTDSNCIFFPCNYELFLCDPLLTRF